MKRYEFTITGQTPLLMHHDNIQWADDMEAWKARPESKKVSKAGDDRSPAWRWIGCLYHDGARLALPQDMIMSCLMQAGAMVPVPGGKNGKTFKAQTQSGMMLEAPFCEFEGGVGPVNMADINALMSEDDFTRHREAAKALGFDLFLKRAKIGQSKHVRVRPRFNQWSASGALVVWDEQLTEAVLRDIFAYAGRYKGLGDWRPGGKTPGPHGMFEASIKAG